MGSVSSPVVMAAQYLCYLGILLVVLPTRVQTVEVQAARRPPVVFVPGTAGSQLDASLDKPNDPKDSCPKTSGWFRLWLDVWSFIFGRNDCWAANFQMYYNKRTGRSENAPGVRIRIPGWGVTNSVEYIDPSWTAWTLGNIGQYAAPLIKGLVKLGYVVGEDLHAAPYDFRLAPHSQAKLFQALRTLIEKTFRENSNQRVVLVAHSMGGLFTMYFLNQQSQEWKSRYINKFISLNTPWTGTAEVLQLHASGFTFGISCLDPWVFRTEQRSQETNLYLLPTNGRSEYDWNPSDVLLSTPRRNYTAADLEQFFRDVGYPLANVIRRHFRDSAYEVKSPGVPFYCLHSSGVQTTEKLIYERGWDVEKRPTTIVKGPGDGTVNLRSLKGCAKVNPPESAAGRFYMRDFPGSDHNGIMKDDTVLAYIKEVLEGE